MIERMKDLTLGRKLALYLFLFIFLPLLIASVVINARASEAITGKTKDNMLQVLKQTKFTLENMIRETDYLSLTILSDDKLQELIKFYEKKAYLDVERNKNQLFLSFHTLLNSRPYIHSISISSDEEVLFQYGEPVSREDTAYHADAKALKGKVLWTPAYSLRDLVKEEEQVRVVSLIRAINDLNSPKILGVERISIEETAISDLFGGVHSWKGGSIRLMDKDGRMLSSPDKSLLTERAPAEEEPYLRKAWNSQEGYYAAEAGGTATTVFFYTLPETGWKIVQLIPDKELSPQLGVANGFILICMAICLMFGILFSLIQNFSVVRPLKQLYREMSKVKNGQFDVKLDTRSRDELGRVSFIFVGMVNQIQDLIERVYKGQLREKEAELKAMQAQINPHFLYNTLDSIRWMAVRNKDFAVSEQIEALSDLFRHTLNQGKEITTVQGELDHLNNYLFIQQNRFGDRLDWRIEADEELLGARTPKLILQPLVENAIVHGLENKVGGGTILVRVSRTESGDLSLSVKDNGIGTEPKPIQDRLAHAPGELEAFALTNIQERIRLRHGAPYGLTFESIPGIGTHVTVLLPIEFLTEEENGA